MQDIEPYWDERLFTRGIDAISWDGAAAADGASKRIEIIFSELVDDRRLELEERLLPNTDETEYRPVLISDDLRERGIRDLRVEVFRNPSVHSNIYITMEGETEPFRVVKRY